MAMCEPSRKKNLKRMEYPKLIWSAVDSLVNLLARPEVEKGKKMTGFSGRKCFASWENLGQSGYWAKTLQGCSQLLMFPGDKGELSEPYCSTWPRWGIVSDGRATELVTLARRTKGTGYVSWPTPTVADTFTGNLKSSQQKPGSMHSVNLSQAVHLPTSDSRSGAGCGDEGADARDKGQLNADWVEGLMGFAQGWTDADCDDPQEWQGWPALLSGGKWPTPQCFDATVGDLKGKEYSGGRHSLKLGNCIMSETGQYEYEPPRIIKGQKHRVKRLKCLGNAVVPQQFYPILAAIAAVENAAISK